MKKTAVKDKIIKKLKSPVVWATVITNIATIIAVFNTELSEQVKTILIAVQQIINAFGILNNPDARKKF